MSSEKQSLRNKNNLAHKHAYSSSTVKFGAVYTHKLVRERICSSCNTLESNITQRQILILDSVMMPDHLNGNQSVILTNILSCITEPKLKTGLRWSTCRTYIREWRTETIKYRTELGNLRWFCVQPFLLNRLDDFVDRCCQFANKSSSGSWAFSVQEHRCMLRWFLPFCAFLTSCLKVLSKKVHRKMLGTWIQQRQANYCGCWFEPIMDGNTDFAHVFRKKWR